MKAATNGGPKTTPLNGGSSIAPTRDQLRKELVEACTLYRKLQDIAAFIDLEIVRNRK